MTYPLRTLRALSGLRIAALGFLALQVVWIFAVPPFRGVDEWDHAYRAAAVADGQWAPTPAAATRGTGAWLDVPEELVRAAGPECSATPYTRAHDCEGTPVDADTVRVASGAGRYHPMFYELIGVPAAAFEGSAALYAMRVVAALLSWAFFVLALAATRCWARTRWPYVALSVAATPVLVYSTMIPAPNGVEMTAALALWSSLLGLALRSDSARDGRLLAYAALAATTLVTLRSLGPVWCALILCTVLVGVRVNGARVREVLLRSRGWLVAFIVLLGTIASLAWIRSMSSLVVSKSSTPMDPVEKLTTTAKQAPLWVLQSIAAFPTRSEQTHATVYVLFLMLFGALLVAAFRASARRGRVALVLAVALSVLVPAAITYSTVETFGTAWQGRYTLPYAVGIVLLAGMLLDQATFTTRTDVVVAGGLFYVVAHAVGPVLVAARERTMSPGVDNGAWLLAPPALLAATAVVGASLLWLGAAFAAGDHGDDDPDVAPDHGTGSDVALSAAR